ncbi:MAG: hypothetical protein ACOX4I_09400 [Anaerovoracaceae bacterium]
MGVDINTLDLSGSRRNALESGLPSSRKQTRWTNTKRYSKKFPRVRADFGYPPLVTPSSQIVGKHSQCSTVITGERYKMVPNEAKQLVKGNVWTHDAADQGRNRQEDPRR